PLPTPLLVRKKVVPADCADAGPAAASADKTATHAATLFTGKFICSSTCSAVSDFERSNSLNPRRQRFIPAPAGANEKGAAELSATPFFLSRQRRSVGLLDRREHPVAAARPHEGPDLRRLGGLLAAADQAAGVDVDITVDHREAHRDAGVLG